MKFRFFFKYLVAMILVAGSVASCYDGMTSDVSISSVRHGRKFVTSMTFAPMDNIPETKSQYTGSETVVNDWNLFVFDATGTRVGAYYKADGGDIEFSVLLGQEYTYFALANVGNMTASTSEAMHKTDIASFRAMTLDVTGYSGGLPMAWTGTRTFTREEYDNNNRSLSLDVQMKRLVGKFNIVYDPSLLSKWSYDVKTLNLYGVSTVKPFVEGSTGSSNATVNDSATAADIVALNGGQAVKFFPVENVVPTPSNLQSNTDPWRKVPGEVGLLYPSYIEITGEATMTDGSALKKNVTFRFYLGKDNVKNFEVVRNEENTITFQPTDDSIEEDPTVNWKVEPEPITDTRSIRFQRNINEATSATNPFLLRSGLTSDEAVVRLVDNVASDFKYNVEVQGGTPADWLTVDNATGQPVSSLSSVTMSSLHLSAKAGTDAEGWVLISTLDGKKTDKLYVKVFNATIDVKPDDPITWDWNEHTQKDVTVTCTVPWTVTVPSGWSLTYATGGDVTGEQPACSNLALKILPPTADYMDIAEDGTSTLSFSAPGTEGDAVTLIRRFKPQVTSGGSSEATLSWNWDESGGDDAKVLTISSNEDWVVVWPEGDHSHWDVSPEDGAATATSITAYPVEDNDSPAAITGTFYVVPVRNGNNVDGGRLTVTLTHNPNDPYIEVSGGDLTEGALRWLWYQKQAKAFTVAANIPWEVVPDEAATASFNISANAATGVVTVTPKDYNYVTDALSGSVTVRGTGDFASMAQVVSLSQSRYPSITVDPASYDWQRNDYSDHSFTVSIAADETYQCRFATYVQDGSQYSSHFGTNHSASTYVGDGESFVIYPTSNCTPTSPSIYGYVYVYLSGASGAYGDAAIPHVSVPLSWGAQPYIDITGDDLENGALKWVWYQDEEVVKTFRVTSNIAWEVVPDAGATASFDISANTSTGVITVAPKGSNSVTSALSGSITVRGTGSNASVTGTMAVRQSRYPQIVADPLSYSWVRGSYDVQSFDLLILADEDYDRCTYSVWGVNGARYDTYFSCLGTYASPDGPSGPGTPVRIRPKSACGEISSGLNAYVLVALDGNFGNAAPPRTTIPITWGADPYLDITPNAASLTWYWYEDDANAQVIAVSSNVAWETSITGADADKFARVRDGENIRVYPVAENGLERTLDATLNITVPSATTLNRTVSLSQTKHPVLTASPATLTFPWDWTSGASTVTVTSDIGWTAALDANGIANFTISGNSGSGNGSITVSPKGQNTDEVNAKTGRIIFTGVGEHNTGITCEVVLSQNKKQAKVYTNAYFKIEGYDHFGFHDAYTYKAYVIGVYDGGEDILDDVTASATWSCEGGFSSYVESAALASGDYRVQVKNTTTGTLTGRVSASFTGTYESIYVYNDDHIDVTVDAYPYLAAHDVTVAWNDTDWHDAWSTNVSSGINITGYDSDWCNCLYWYGIRATGNNTGSSSRSCTVTVSGYAHDYLDDVDIPVSGTFTFTQEANAGPAYNTYTAAYVDAAFGPYGSTIDVGDYTTVDATLYTGTCITTATTAPQDKSVYTWDGGTDVTSSGFSSYNTGVATVTNTNRVNGISAGTAKIESNYVPSTSDYDVVFTDDDYVTVTVVSGAVITHELIVSIEDPEIGVGGRTQATAEYVTYSDGVETSRVDVTNTSSCSWSSSNTSVATVTNSNPRGRITGEGAGTTDINASYRGESGSASITVTPAPVTTIYKVVTTANPDELYVGESTSLSATLYSSTDDGSHWTVVSSSPNGFGKVSGTSVINTSTGKATTTGTGVYRGQFNGYDIDSDKCEDASITVTEAPVTTIYKVVTTANPDELHVGESTSLSATLYSSTDDGSHWTVVSSSPNGFGKVSGTSVINTSTGKATTTGTGVYRGQFNGYSIDSDKCEDASITVTEAPVTLDHIAFVHNETEVNAARLDYSNSWLYDCQVWAFYSNGNHTDITSQVTISCPTGFYYANGQFSTDRETSGTATTSSWNGMTASIKLTSVDALLLGGINPSFEDYTGTPSQPAQPGSWGVTTRLKITAYFLYALKEGGENRDITGIVDYSGDIGNIKLRVSQTSDWVSITPYQYATTGTTFSLTFSYQGDYDTVPSTLTVSFTRLGGGGTSISVEE